MAIKEETVWVGLGSKNTDHFEKLGYLIPRSKDRKGRLTVRRGTKIEVKVSDLPKASSMKLKLTRVCDVCGFEMLTKNTRYVDIINMRDAVDGLDRCPKCRYKSTSGENHWRYNINLTEEERAVSRNTIGYYDWRLTVYKRDDFTCQCCGQRSGKLNAHHLDGYHWCKERRLDNNNGVTLCNNCHILDDNSFHKINGKENNTTKQFDEWLLNYKYYFILKMS